MRARSLSRRGCRVLWAAAIAAALTVICGPLGSAGAGIQSMTKRGQLAVSMGVSAGLNGHSRRDVLHLGDSGWDNYVNHYLNQMNVSWVHLNVPWCALEPKDGVYDQSIYQSVKTRVDKAAASGKHMFVTVITDAPVFARRAAMQRDRNGKPLDSSYTGCGRPKVYPGGEAAPKLTKLALDHYANAVRKFKACLKGTFCRGPDNRSRVMIESGAEGNWHAGWQTGICARHSGYGGEAWYRSPGKDCGEPGPRQMSNGKISRIQEKDARFFGDMANLAARKLHGSLAFGDDVILGAPLFRRNGIGWGTGSVAGPAYVAQSIRGGTAHDRWSRAGRARDWDAAALHVTVCNSGVRVSWNDCPGSMKDRVDQLRSALRAAHINVPIWITGALPCSEGNKKRVHGHVVYKCTATAQARQVKSVIHGLRSHECSRSARPVQLINWFRIVDPDNGGQFTGIGFMRNRPDDPYVPPYVKKPAYNAMAESSNLSCRG